MKRSLRNLKQNAQQLISKRSIRRAKSPTVSSFTTLEPRLLLSGNVSATVSDGMLTIAGDRAANAIVLNQTGLKPHQVRILGNSNTTINGQVGSVVMNGVKADVLIRLDNGADSISLRSMSFPQTLRISQGGHDALSLSNIQVARNLFVRNSSSLLSVNTTITNTTVGKDLEIVSGDGSQHMDIASLEVNGNTQIETGRRYDVLTVNDSIFHGDVQMSTGRGVDVIELEAAGNAKGPRTRFYGSAEIAMGDGDDALQLGIAGQSGNRSAFFDAVDLDGGAGFDTLRGKTKAAFAETPHIQNFESTNPAEDTTAPTVSATDPANGATGVARNRKIAASFSKPMNPLTVTAANVSVKAGNTAVAGTVVYVGTTMTFTPSHQLAANTTYTGTITTGAKDLAGNPLASNFAWSFTTGATADTTAPTVSSTSPLNVATNVAINKTIAATFTESMDALTLSTDTFTLKGPGNSAVIGTVSYVAPSKIATFTPSSNLAPNTTYTARIKSGVNGAKDLAGNALSSDKVWTFTTGSQIAQARIDLGRASGFAVMATASISGTGPTQINGDVGLNPGSAQGIPPAQVNGTIHIDDQAIIDAQSDLLAAYGDAVSRSVTSQSLPGNMGGLTFTPGLYTNSTSVLIQGAGPANNVTLDAQGDPNAIFIFKMGSTLTTGAGAQVILAGGAKASNIFWQVGSSATLNTTTIFKGNILASVTITVNAGSAVEGRLLGGSNSAGSVTVNASTVTVPAA